MIKKDIKNFGIIIPALLLTLWSRSWLLIGIVSILCMIFWHPSTITFINYLKRKLTRKQLIAGEWITAGVLAMLFVWFIQFYVINIYTLRSDSMLPNYKSGNLIVINKLIYGPALNTNSSKYYRRITGLRNIERGDVIAFHFPEADTAFEEHPDKDYYFIKRQYANTKSYNPLLDDKIIYKKVTKRLPFIKRIIGLPGDTLKIVDGDYQVNSKRLDLNSGFINKYVIKKDINNNLESKIINGSQVSYRKDGQQFIEIEAHIVDNNDWGQYLDKSEAHLNMPDSYVFPFSPGYFWNASFFGPVIIPSKGKTVKLTITNIALYKRIIETYETNSIKIIDDSIYINNKKTNEYTFRLNYYWVAGDNKKHSLDSRYWGFLPENHIIGKVVK